MPLAQSLSFGQQRYLWIDQGLITAAFSLVANGFFAWLVFRVDPVPVWAVQPAVGPDLLLSSFFLPSITCLFVTVVVRYQVRIGMVQGTAQLPACLRPMQRGLLVRSILFGLVGMVLVGGPACLLLWGMSVDSWGLTFFVWFKAILSACVAQIVAPLIAWVALADR